MSVCLLPLWARDSEFSRSALSLKDGDSGRAASVVVSLDEDYLLNVDCLFPRRLEAQNVVERVAASKLETQDLVSVIASSLTGQRFRTLVICCSPFLDRTQTQNRC